MEVYYNNQHNFFNFSQNILTKIELFNYFVDILIFEFEEASAIRTLAEVFVYDKTRFVLPTKACRILFN